MRFEKHLSIDLAPAGLGTVLLLAGATKFTMPQFWTGYEPEVIRNLVSPEIFLQLSGALEFGLGAWIISGWKRTVSSLISTLWLLAITLQITSLGLYAIAIRDIGLVFLSLAVFKGAAGDLFN